MSLKTYHQKRHFDRTAEPRGALAKKYDHVFVVQKHAASHLHYDLRLAMNGVLKSWAVPKGPCLNPAVKRLAVEVEDHPLEYATFEGDIPKGEYGGGNVIVWDYGHWQATENLAKAYKKGAMKFSLEGHKLHGNWKLIRFKTERNKSQWLLIKAKDKYSKASDYDITAAKPQSVLSERKPKKTAKSKKESNVNKKTLTPAIAQEFKPELATLSLALTSGSDWIYETKFDGYRILAYVNKNDVRLFSRNHLDWTEKFPSIVNALKKLNLVHALLDGEVVALDKNSHSNFQVLQNFLNEDRIQADLHYFVFDMPYYQNKDLTELTLLERKKYLQQAVKGAPKLIHYTDHLEGNSKQLLKIACEKGQEGIIAKLKNSSYMQARNKNWLKLKCHRRDEFIVVGFTAPGGARKYFGSLLLATYINKKLIYCGNVGTGFNEDSLKEIYQKLIKLKREEMPLSVKPAVSPGKDISWVKPKLVVDVEFTEWTEDGRLRHPSFKGIRADKAARNVKKEIPLKKLKAATELSHPDKMLFVAAGVTKQGLADYYEKIADKLLPYIKNRPLTVVRCPEPDKCFYQKHWTEGMPESIDKINVTKQDQYLSVNTKKGLIALAQLAILEIHPWASRKDKLEYPDQIIFDLDPDVGLSWKSLLEATLLVHKTLDSLNLKNFVKLTGGKGIHIVIPIERTQDYVQIKKFTKMLAEKLAEHFPQLFTANMSKKKRGGKIFLDYLRNEHEATAIAPFSPRKYPQAFIAVPISWKKLTTFKNAAAYSILTIDQYFKDFPRDPWKVFFKVKQAITRQHFQALTRL